MNEIRYLHQTQNTDVRAQSEVTWENNCGAWPFGGAIKGKNIKHWSFLVLVQKDTRVYKDIGPVQNGTLNPRGLPLSPHFHDVMPL